MKPLRFCAWFSPLIKTILPMCLMAVFGTSAHGAASETIKAKVLTGREKRAASYWNELAKALEEDPIYHVDHFDETELPPIRWEGDGMDSVFGAAEYNDLQVKIQIDSVAFRRVWNLPAAIEEYERRFAKKPRENKDFPQIPVLKFQWCRIEQFNFAAGGGRKSVGCLLNFYQCEFLDDAYFHSVTFKNGIGFCGSSFKKYVGFRGAEFPVGLSLLDTRFEAEANVEGATFGGQLSLCRSHFAQPLELTWADFDNVTWLDLSGLRIVGRTALGGDLKMRLDQFKGRILGESAIEPLIGPIEYAYPPKEPLKGADRLTYAAHQYSVLAGNFSASNEPMSWPTADWCHSRSCDLRRKAAWMDASYGEWVKQALWKIVFGNGVDWRYPAILALGVILGFALVYLWRGKDVECSDGRHDSANRTLAQVGGFWKRLLTSLYFSLVTFSTLGYGDWRPRRYARAFAAVEALSGPVLMAALVVIMVRKIIR